MIGIAFKNVSSLQDSFVLTKKALQLFIALRPSSSPRAVHFEEYAEYVVMDYAIRGIEAGIGRNYALRMFNAKANMLYLYDLKNNENYTDILYHYLSTNGNLKQTSRFIYMHPNTIHNKLNIIRRIIDDDLKDPLTCRRILWTLQAFRYYKYCKKQDISSVFTSLMLPQEIASVPTVKNQSSKRLDDAE